MPSSLSQGARRTTLRGKNAITVIRWMRRSSRVRSMRTMKHRKLLKGIFCCPSLYGDSGALLDTRSAPPFEEFKNVCGQWNTGNADGAWNGRRAYRPCIGRAVWSAKTHLKIFLKNLSCPFDGLYNCPVLYIFLPCNLPHGLPFRKSQQPASLHFRTGIQKGSRISV